MTVLLSPHVKAVTPPPGVEIRIRTTPLSTAELAELRTKLATLIKALK